MSVDRQSDQAYNDLKAKGKLEADQLSVLNVYRKALRPLTVREGHEIALKDGLSIDFNGFRSRTTELTSKEPLDLKPLEKFDKVKDVVSGKTVNRWRVKDRYDCPGVPPSDFFLPFKA